MTAPGNVDGFNTWLSTHPAAETSRRLKAAITAAGLTVFAHIDHAAAAGAVGLSLPFTDVLIFGDPKAGTP